MAAHASTQELIDLLAGEIRVVLEPEFSLNLPFNYFFKIIQLLLYSRGKLTSMLTSCP